MKAQTRRPDNDMESVMTEQTSEHTPSQAEGEPEDTGHRDVPRTTPSQAEGDDEGSADDDTEGEGGE